MAVANASYVLLPTDQGLGFLHAICNVMNADSSALNNTITDLCMTGTEGTLVKHLLLVLLSMTAILAAVYASKLARPFLYATTFYFVLAACRVLGFPLLVKIVLTCCIGAILNYNQRWGLFLFITFMFMSALFQSLVDKWNVWLLDILSIAVGYLIATDNNCSFESNFPEFVKGFVGGISLVILLFVATCIIGHPMSAFWQLVFISAFIFICLWKWSVDRRRELEDERHFQPENGILLTLSTANSSKAMLSLFDQDFAQSIRQRYTSCIASKCDILERFCKHDSIKCLVSTTTYTSCVTSCAAAQMVETTVDIHDRLNTILSLGYDEFAGVQGYLEYHDTKWLNSHDYIYVGRSLCLPNEFFVEWNQIIVPTKLTTDPTTTYFVPATLYINHCQSQLDSSSWSTFILCDQLLLNQLIDLKRSGIGILDPNQVKKLDPLPRQNPTAENIVDQVCVAVVANHSQSVQASRLLIKAMDDDENCSSDTIGSVIVHYEQHGGTDLPYFTLPNTSFSNPHFNPWMDGYCTMNQYASYLEKELFTSCDQDAATLACFVQVWAVKAMCMQTVLQTHLMPNRSHNAFGRTAGEAASVLVGLLGCEVDITRDALSKGVINPLAYSTQFTSTQSVSDLPLGAIVFILIIGAIVAKQPRRRPTEDVEFVYSLL